MRYLISGGAGFLGSHLCDYLINMNHEVICVDNLITGKTSNLEKSWHNENFRFIEYDVTQPFYCEKKIDGVFHLASPASPIDYLQHPIHTLKVGANGTYNLLGLAKHHQAKFLLASTSEVYGDPKVHPQHEDYWGHVNPIGPRGVYDEAKRYAEAITMAYHRKHNMETKIARIFNTFGPRMRLDDGRAVPNFIGQALRGDPLTIYGNGLQTRSFCYVSDLIEGLDILMNKNYSHPINLGNPNEMSIIDFAHEIKRLCKSKSEIIHETLPTDDPMQRKPDITRAKEILNWEPKILLEDGLKTVVKYFQTVIKVIKYENEIKTFS